MRREYRNFNSVVRVSCLLLLLLAFLAVNPISSSSVFAESDNTTNANDNTIVDTSIGSPNSNTIYKLDDNSMERNVSNVDVNNVSNDSDDSDNANTGIMPLADTSTNTSIVGISFSPVQYYASLSPTDSAGKTARIDITAMIDVYNSGGYTVYLKGNDTNLVGTSNSNSVIPSLSGNVTYANIPVNTWGYAKAVDTDITASTTYKAIGISNNGDELTKNDEGKNIEHESRTIALSFATKINNQKPADTYSNTMTLSVVSSPLKTTLINIANLQDMTSAVCAASTEGQSKQLKDTRDNKYYWVTKLADGKCWMTQNLALDLATNLNATGGTVKTFYNTDTDLNSRTSWTPTSGTYTTVTGGTGGTILANDTGQRSWNLGSYYIKTPNGTTSCGSAKNSLANCTSYFTALDTPTSANGDTNAHYITSHYYQWCAATAGCTSKTDTSKKEANFTSGEAADSICPKGWRLPTSGDGKEFQTLMNQYNVTSGTNISGTTNTLVSSPLYFVRGGLVWQDSDLLLDAGSGGHYWSSTAKSGASSYDLYFGGTSDIHPSNSNDRQVGRSVRCLAK